MGYCTNERIISDNNRLSFRGWRLKIYRKYCEAILKYQIKSKYGKGYKLFKTINIKPGEYYLTKSGKFIQVTRFALQYMKIINKSIKMSQDLIMFGIDQATFKEQGYAYPSMIRCKLDDVVEIKFAKEIYLLTDHNKYYPISMFIENEPISTQFKNLIRTKYYPYIVQYHIHNPKDEFGTKYFEAIRKWINSID